MHHTTETIENLGYHNQNIHFCSQGAQGSICIGASGELESKHITREPLTQHKELIKVVRRDADYVRREDRLAFSGDKFGTIKLTENPYPKMHGLVGGEGLKRPSQLFNPAPREGLGCREVLTNQVWGERGEGGVIDVLLTVDLGEVGGGTAITLISFHPVYTTLEAPMTRASSNFLGS